MRISIHTKNYPQKFMKLKQPPPFVFFEGCKSLFQYNYISVVGGRNILPWVPEWLENELLPVLKKLNIGVISGGARGVDQCAHWLALRAGVPTLVVLPCSLDEKYPNNLLKFEGWDGVGFLSEYEPQTKMRKGYFHRRNQLIAALSPYTLVVQASERSGTMITARAAMDLGNTLMALPGNPMEDKMAGNNQLIFDGASMIRNQNDFLQILNSFSSNFYEQDKEKLVAE